MTLGSECEYVYNVLVAANKFPNYHTLEVNVKTQKLHFLFFTSTVSIFVYVNHKIFFFFY